MSNSKLVSYKHMSPNCYVPRTYKISGITIHHMAGNLNVQQCGNVFANPSAEASANYGVASDGTIGQYVDEANAAWTSSNWENDNRCITIEVANDQIGGNWHVSDVALEATINLCVDICKRNGIPALNYTGDTSGNLTMHRWFAATACPGDYLASQFPYIAREVNKRLGSTTGQVVDTIPVPDQPTSGDGELLHFTYSVKTKKHGILPEVTNLQDYAGIPGDPITDVAIKVDRGSVRYRVHVLGASWLPYVDGCDWTDDVNGYAGNGLPIDAIEVYYSTPADIVNNYGYQKAQYRVSPLNCNYWPWQFDNEVDDEQDGYAGSFGRAIDCFQLF